MRNCAFLTCKDLTGFVHDDNLLVGPLEKIGWNVQSVAWDSAPDWQQFDAVVIRTTWDYTERRHDFLQTLQTIESMNVKLFNPSSIARWNSDKNYLLDLELRDIPIVPTVIHRNLFNLDLHQFFEKWNCESIVVKPVVGANAKDTFWLDKAAVGERREALDQAFAKKSLMVQPFVESVKSEGEYSLHYFDGRFSHAILKTPKDGDFRVQEEHGGVVKPIQPSKSLLTAADRVMVTSGQGLLYARVDLVQSKPDDWQLMELELIEPALYLRTDPKAAGNFIEAFMRTFDRSKTSARR